MKYSLKLANGRTFKNPPPSVTKRILVLYVLPLYKIPETVITFLSQEIDDAHQTISIGQCIGSYY